MNKVHLPTAETSSLGDWALLAIQKHFQKVLNREASVLKDRDPEDLHQMRVGMRRLRSAIAGFAPAIDLPKPAQEQKIGKVARKLGNLRDLDVLQETLQSHYQPALPSEEQAILESALAYLSKQRQKALIQVKKTLEKQRYYTLKQSLQEWLQHPHYQEIAQMPISVVLPDLLLPEVSRLLLHPGWLVGTQRRGEEITLLKELKPEQVHQKLVEQGPLLHSLRKQAKRTRYQMEVFKEFYSESYENYLQDVKTIQEILGHIQDGFVLAEFLESALKSKLKNILPTLDTQLAEASYQAWQQWRSLQQQYLSLQTRKDFHLAILQPTFAAANNDAVKN